MVGASELPVMKKRGGGCRCCGGGGCVSCIILAAVVVVAVAVAFRASFRSFFSRHILRSSTALTTSSSRVILVPTPSRVLVLTLRVSLVHVSTRM